MRRLGGWFWNKFEKFWGNGVKVLIACEYSGRVRDAFIRGGA